MGETHAAGEARIQRSKEATASLLDEARKTVALLVKLTALQDQDDEESTVMPIRALQDAKGLAFVFTTRAALAIGISVGTGFLIRKLMNGSSGAVKWSAPCFFSIRKLTVGISYGWGTVNSCIAISDEELFQQFKSGHPILGLDTRIMACASEVTGGGTVSAPSDSLVTYSLSDGAMVDVSLAGGALTVDRTRHEELYYPGVSADHIMDGAVPAPQEFDELYNALNTYIKL